MEFVSHWQGTGQIRCTCEQQVKGRKRRTQRGEADATRGDGDAAGLQGRWKPEQGPWTASTSSGRQVAVHRLAMQVGERKRCCRRARERERAALWVGERSVWLVWTLARSDTSFVWRRRIHWVRRECEASGHRVPARGTRTYLFFSCSTPRGVPEQAATYDHLCCGGRVGWLAGWRLSRADSGSQRVYGVAERRVLPLDALRDRGCAGGGAEPGAPVGSVPVSTTTSAHLHLTITVRWPWWPCGRPLLAFQTLPA